MMPNCQAGFPAGTALQPTIFVRNVTAKKQAASITLSWRGDSGKGRGCPNSVWRVARRFAFCAKAGDVQCSQTESKPDL